jgi:four helix bundle protein
MAVEKTKMHSFKELNVWNMSMEIAEEVNIMVESMPTHQIWTLGSQLLKTTISIPSNIAEGCGRASNNQLYYFLNVAMASTFELETQLLLAVRFKAVDKEKAEETIKKLESVQKMTRKLMDSVLKRK